MQPSKLGGMRQRMGASLALFRTFEMWGYASAVEGRALICVLANSAEDSIVNPEKQSGGGVPPSPNAMRKLGQICPDPERSGAD